MEVTKLIPPIFPRYEMITAPIPDRVCLWPLSFVSMLGLLVSMLGVEGCAGEVKNSLNPIDGSVYKDAFVVPTPKCQGKESTVGGTVFAPNGQDPVPNALVALLDQSPQAFPSTVKCELCGDPLQVVPLWQIKSNFDGKFSLDQVCPGKYWLLIQNGRFRRVLTVDITPNSTVNLSADKTRLPKRNAEFDPQDTIPKIAVASGDYDKMECILLNMGLEKGVFDIYEGTKDLKVSPALPTFASLVADANKMMTYNIIFINCAADTFETELAKADIRQNITKYLQAGGRFYVTDWSYDWIEQVDALSPFITFEGGTDEGKTPETPSAAQKGPGGVIIQATVKSTDLAKWLGLFPNTINNGIMALQDFSADWAMMKSTSKDVKVWMEGTVQNVVHPLTVTFNVNYCGKVLYTSYHTEGRDDELMVKNVQPVKPFPDYCSKEIPAKHRILEYLIFDISNCVRPIDTI